MALLLVSAVMTAAAVAQDQTRSLAFTAPARDGVILSLNGPVTPASAQYLEREIRNADAADAELIVIEVDTPGGLVDSMKTIVKAILASETPVATFVSPQGARSASAGLYIMYASHVAAMSPYTNTGAATPVELGGGPARENPFENETPVPDETPAAAPESAAPPDAAAPDNDAQASGPDAAGRERGAADRNGAGETDRPSGEFARRAEELVREIAPATNRNDPAGEERSSPSIAPSSDASMRAKIINDSVAYIRALAEERGRNADWAERAVREGVSVTHNEALSLGVVDLIADDLDDLLSQIDGKSVSTVAGDRTLSTVNLRLARVEPTMLERILGFIANPNVAAILMSLAITGITIEMWNPGSIFPGALGVLCLFGGLYAFQVLPFNWLGVALIGLGVVLMVLEAYTPTFGVAGLVGLLTFAGGLFVVFPAGFEISVSVIATILVTVGALLGLVLFAVIGSRSHGPLIGAEAIRRREGVVDHWDGKEGWVIVEGERWRARSDKPLQRGDRVRVLEVDGLVLVVRQIKAGGLLASLAPSEA
ncbi:MAG: nodulation protein NfeD [Alphaproteobacteria bacterium]|nr:nodulation protein NfeD [Alphaproteobacteria bacterium]